MYYIIEAKSSRKEYLYEFIEISTTPAVSIYNDEEITNGFVHNMSDRSVYAHGEYDTIEEARKAITKKFGGVTQLFFEFGDGDAVETYTPNSCISAAAAAAAAAERREEADWAYVRIKSDIKVHTTDERIEELVEEYKFHAFMYDLTLDRCLRSIMKERRQELREELG